MQVNNIQSPSFQAIHVQGSKMSKIQRNVAEKLVDSISYSDAYMKAYNELIDVCFVSSKDKVVDVMFLDRESNKFIRNGRDEILRVTSKTGQKLSDISTRIQNKLEEIVNGKYVREKFNPEIYFWTGWISFKAVLNEIKASDGEKIMFTKGAVDGMMGRITRIRTKDGLRPIAEADRDWNKFRRKVIEGLEEPKTDIGDHH